MEYGTGELEYYDLVNDPFELESSAGALDGSQLRRLKERVHALATCRRSGCRSLEAAPLSPGLSGKIRR